MSSDDGDGGKTFYKCSECGAVVEDVFDLVGHSCWQKGGESSKVQSRKPPTVPARMPLVAPADGLESATSCEQSVSWTTVGDNDKSLSTAGGNTNANWNAAATRLLIAEYKKYEDKISTGKITKAKVWALISKTLEQYNYFYLSSQVEGRWKTLLDRYRRVRDGMSGSSREDFVFFEELDEMFEGHPNIVPPAIAGSSLDKPKAKSSSLKGKPKLKKNPGTATNMEKAVAGQESVRGKKRKTTDQNIDTSQGCEDFDLDLEDNDNGLESEELCKVPKTRNTQASLIIQHLEKTRKESEKSLAARHSEKMGMWRELINVLKHAP